MTIDHKELINKLVEDTVKMLGSKSGGKQIIADSDSLYDVQINLRSNNLESSSIRQIRLSYDNDAGYFINIDNITLEFDHDLEAFEKQLKVYLEAIRDDKLSIREKKRFWLFSVSEVCIDK